MRVLKTKISGVLIALIITLLYPRLGCIVANNNAIAFNMEWMYIHHSVQLLLALLSIILIIIFSNSKYRDWGLSTKKWRWSVKTALCFALGWLVISLVINLITGAEARIAYEPGSFNIASDLFFDFVLTGFSEEVLFRGLIMGILLITWQGNIKIGNFKISIAGIIASLLFALAHIGIDYQTMTISSISLMQLLFALGLGLFYAWMRDKTNSLIGPIIAHGASDGILTIILLVLC